MRLQTRPSSPLRRPGVHVRPSAGPRRRREQAAMAGPWVCPRLAPRRRPRKCPATSRRCGAGPSGDWGTGFEAEDGGAPTLGPVSLRPDVAGLYASGDRAAHCSEAATSGVGLDRPSPGLSMARGWGRTVEHSGARGLRALRVLDRSSRLPGSRVSRGARGRCGPRLGDGFVRAGGGGAEGGSGREPEVGPATLLPFGGDTSFPLLSGRPRPGTGCVLLARLGGRTFAAPGNLTRLVWPNPKETFLRVSTEKSTGPVPS